MSTEAVNPGVPPNTVVWAYRLWLASGVLLALWGLFQIALVRTGTSVVFGVFFILVGVALVWAGRQAYAGDPRWRSAVSVLTLMLVAIGIFASMLYSLPMVPALLFALIGLSGSLTANRPTSEPWFARR
ncbi:hypothetical protein [Williamsia muralis]|uniref:hypothetical protein n=1 Tax=Williamsia marianensis TaxID=85044 RepID=UPI003F5CEF87